MMRPGAILLAASLAACGAERTASLPAPIGPDAVDVEVWNESDRVPLRCPRPEGVIVLEPKAAGAGRRTSLQVLDFAAGSDRIVCTWDDGADRIAVTVTGRAP